MPNSYTSYEGFEIITDKQTIRFGIQEGQFCSEQSGYIVSNDDDLNEFVGADLLSISLTDTGLNTKSVQEIENLYENNIMFVNFNTSKGLM